MLSSIKSQTLKQTTSVSSTTAALDNPQLHQHDHSHLIEDILIMPLNKDDTNNLFGTTIVATSTVPSTVQQNFVDSKILNNNNNNYDNNYELNMIENNSITSTVNDTQNLFNINNNKNENNINKYEIKDDIKNYIMSIPNSVASTINDTQNLHNTKKENIINDYAKNDNIKNYITSIPNSIKSTNTINSNDILVYKSSNYNNSNNDNNNKNIDNINNNESELFINSISTIPINNAKDFINNNDTINNLIQQQQPNQKKIVNNLVNITSEQLIKSEQEIIPSSSISPSSNFNSNSIKNGLKSNNNNIDDKSALFNSFTDSNNSNINLSFCKILPTPSLTKSQVNNDLNQKTSLPCNNVTKLQQSQSQHPQSIEGIKFLTTDMSNISTKLLNNIKISTFNKLLDSNKNATTTTATETTSVTTNSNSNNSVIDTPLKTTNTLKRVGFISLEQNGWNLNFITTTSLVPPSSTTTTNNTIKFETSQIPTKTTTINSSYNNRISNYNDNLIKSNLNVVRNSSNKNIINNQVNSTIVNRSLIEDVHNYSKKSKRFPMECVSTTNSSVEESEEDDDADDDNDDDDVDYEEDGEEEIGSNEFDYRKFLTTKNKNKKRFQTTIKLESNVEGIGGVKKLNDKIKKIIADQKETSTKDEICKKTQHEISFSGPSTNNDDNGESSLTPEHHARRPMNAFLIFCKRHRAIVRDKYKNVENRQVTKILGEWWENMSQDEKSSYTNLAKEYKDAFLSANPNFKWYKLPAPPLRTLITRPLNTSEPTPEEQLSSTITKSNSTLKQLKNAPLSRQNSPAYEEGIEIVKEEIVDSTTSVLSKNEGNVGVFKFADETQMGGLSSLMAGNNSPSGNNSPDLTKKFDNQSNGHEDLQCALTETSEFISLAMPKTKPDISTLEPFEKMRNHAKKMQLTLKNNKRKIFGVDNVIGVGGKKFIRDNSFSSSEEDNWLRKPTRSCKGKKYQELISSGQIATSSKKIKKSTLNTFAQLDFIKSNTIKDSSSDSDGAAIVHTNFSNNNLSSMKGNQKDIGTENLSNINKTSDIEKSEQCEDNQVVLQSTDAKPFDTNAFDLEAKIMALPAQDLEEYLQKKQESKCKKKIASKRRKNFSSKKISKSNNFNNTSNIPTSSSSLALEISKQKSLTSNEMQDIVVQQKQIDSMKEHIVGSQKRKARKESITRRDLNAFYKTPATVMTESESPMNWVNLSDINTEASSMNVTDSIQCDTVSLKSHEQQSEKGSDHTSSLNKQFTNDGYESKVPEATSNADLLILAEVASNFDE